MWRPRPRTQPPPPARRVAPTQQRERWVGLMTPAPARPQSCKHEKEAAEEVDEKVVVTSFKTKQKHGMEVMMRAGSTGFGVGVGYHYSVKFTAKSTVDTSKEDPDDYANACGDLTEMGCNACVRTTRRCTSSACSRANWAGRATTRAAGGCRRREGPGTARCGTTRTPRKSRTPPTATGPGAASAPGSPRTCSSARSEEPDPALSPAMPKIRNHRACARDARQ